MNKTLVAVAILGTAVSGSAMAQTKQPKPFTLEGGLGFIFTSGNTDTTSANASLEAHQELTDWSNDYSISGLYKQEEVENDDGEKEDRTSAQRLMRRRRQIISWKTRITVCSASPLMKMTVSVHTTISQQSLRVGTKSCGMMIQHHLNTQSVRVMRLTNLTMASLRIASSFVLQARSSG